MSTLFNVSFCNEKAYLIENACQTLTESRAAVHLKTMYEQKSRRKKASKSSSILAPTQWLEPHCLCSPTLLSRIRLETVSFLEQYFPVPNTRHAASSSQLQRSLRSVCCRHPLRSALLVIDQQACVPPPSIRNAFPRRSHIENHFRGVEEPGVGFVELELDRDLGSVSFP